MATLSSTFKHTLKYSANRGAGEETLSRTIAGLNFGSGGDASTGPTNVGVGLTQLISTLNSFTTGTLTDFRYIVERQVNL